MGLWARRVIKTVAVLVGLIVVLSGAVYGVSQYRITRRHDLAIKPLQIASDSATIAHGQHQAIPIAKCVYCHGNDLGGGVVVDDPALGRIVATNLTTGKGGVLPLYTDSLLDRAIRYGIGSDGRKLLLMPSGDYHWLSDDDASALIAYVRSLPPVDREFAPNHVGPVGRALYVAGKLPLFAAEQTLTRPTPPAHTPKGSDKEFGEYLANTGGCTGCHGPGLSGGKIPEGPPDWKPAANITPAGIGGWTEADFTRAMREGIRKNGTPIDPIMPWKLASGMTDNEIHALWAYLQTVPAKSFGNR